MLGSRGFKATTQKPKTLHYNFARLCQAKADCKYIGKHMARLFMVDLAPVDRISRCAPSAQKSATTVEAQAPLELFFKLFGFRVQKATILLGEV